jgi:hypothetical protein
MYRRHERSLNTKLAMRMRRPETGLKCTQYVRNAHTVLVGNPAGSTALGRHGQTWDKNIKIDLKKRDRTCSLTIKEEHRPRVFENRVLRRIFGPKRDEVKGGSRKLNNEGLHTLYSSPSVIRVIK